MTFSKIQLIIILSTVNIISFINSKTIQIGSSRTYKSIQEAKTIGISDNDILELDPGVYKDYHVFSQNGLQIIGVGPGYSNFNLNGVSISNGKAAFVIQGSDVIIDNLEFSWITVNDGNGAGIRWETQNGKLTVRNCYFHNNERALMSGVCNDCELLFEHSHIEISYANGGNLGHNIYMGTISKFTFQFCTTEQSPIGHELKSRAKENYILFNRFLDKDSGSSFSIDLPNGGKSYVIGNIIQEGPNSGNSVTLSYAEEGANNPIQELYVAYNTFVTDLSGSSTAIQISGSPSQVVVTNNIFVDHNRITSYTDTSGFTNNFHCSGSACDELKLSDRTGFDYHLLANSSAINKAIEPSNSLLIPDFEYEDYLKKKERKTHFDLGGYEFDSSYVARPKNPWNKLTISLVVAIPIGIFFLIIFLVVIIIVLIISMKKGNYGNVK